jgi:hypothetical protein
MKFFSLSMLGDIYLTQLEHFQKSKNNNYIRLNFDRMRTCDIEVILITQDPLDMDRICDLGIDPKIVTELHDAWEKLSCKTLLVKNNCVKSINRINKISLPVINPKHEKDFLLRRLSQDQNKKRVLFFIGDSTWIPLDSLFMLSRVCKVSQGLFPSHVSAVLFQDGLYLFGGPSGAGKSTLANLLVDEGGYLLDEDQVIIRKKPDGSYSADAWGYSLKTCDSPIKGVFKLNKNEHNAIESLSTLDAANFIFMQSEQVAGWMLPDDLYRKLFCFTAEFARSIPVNKLHFSLTGDLWSMILETLK